MKGYEFNHELMNTVHEALLEITDAEFGFLELLVAQAKEQREFIKRNNGRMIAEKADRATKMLRDLMGDRV